MAASKKTASKKKRTPAQRRATAKLVAMNKKKRAASKRKTTSRKKTTRRANPVRPLRSRAKKKASARKRNPVGANHWKGSHHVVKFVPRTNTKPQYVTGLNREGTGINFSETRNAAALFALGAAQNILYLARRKAEEAGWSGHMEIDSYHFEAWN